MRKQAFIRSGHLLGLAAFLLLGNGSMAWGVTAPGAAPYSNITSSQLEANWTDSDTGDTFNAILSIDPSPSTNGDSGNISLAAGTNLNALFTPLQPNTTYFVDVNATDPSNNPSAYTSLGPVVTLANAPGVSAFTNVTTSQVQANWTTNGNPAGTTYVAQLSTDPAFGTIIASLVTSNTSATFSGLASNTVYYAQVQAVNFSNTPTPFTNLGSASTSSNAPGFLPFSNVSNSQVQANWTANGSPAGTTYTVILSTGVSPSTNGLGSNINQTTTNTSFTFASLAVNTPYFIDVQAAGSAFTSLGSTATLANTPTPAIPTNIQTNEFTANWSPNGNPQGTTYFAQLSTDPGFGSLITSSSTLDTSATYAGLTPNTTYYSQVQAINMVGITTAFVALPPIVTLANAPGPNAFTSITISQLQANWTANGNPAGTIYTVILSTGASPSTNGSAGNTTLVTTNIFQLFSGLAINTLYYADVKAAGSVFTPLGSAATSANAPTSADPSNVGTNQITANWGTNGNPSGTSYLVQASTDPAFGVITSAVTTVSSSATLTGLSSNTLYSMRVEALNQADVPTSFTPLPQATTLANPPNAPGAAGFTNITTNQLQANWTTNGNSAGVSYTAILSTAASPGTNGLSSNQTVTTSSTSATFSGLLPNARYYVDVDAVSNGGSSAFTSLGFTFSLANPPASAAPSNIGTNQITATWGANGNPAGTLYEVQASTDSLFGSITQTVTNTFSSATLTGLTANTLYFMRVQAFNQNSTPTSFTSLPSATTLESVPNPPGLAAFSNVATNQAQANWTANGNPAGISYTAILSTAPSPSTNGLAGNQTVTTTSLLATFTGLIPNTLYYVDVNGTSTGGSSAYSSLGSVPTLANAPTSGIPTNIQQNQITANWGTNGNPSGTSYLVQASTDPAFGSVAEAITTTTSSATLTGLLASTSYYMQVQANNQNGIGTSFTTLPSAVTLQNIPNAPGVANFTNVTINQLQANWTSNGNPASVTYTAILSSAPLPNTNGLAGNQTLTTSTTSVTFASLSPNILYYVNVNATSTSGSSPYSSLGSIATLANPPISAAPSNIQPNQITANWAANGNSAVTSYLVQAALDSGFISITVQVSTTSLSAALTGLAPQTQYFMRVHATNQNGKTTTFTSLPSATTLSNPPNPPGSAGFTNIAANQLQANWTANGNASSTTYTAILSTAPSPSTNGLPGNQTINTTNLSASFSSLAPNTLYYVAVNATSSGGSSAYTSLGSVPTLANAPTSANPTNIQTNQITANWGTNGNPQGTSYLVQASPNSGFSSITSAVTTTNSSATLTGLLAQTTYFMQVQASNQVGAPTAFIQLPSATTLTTPPNVPGAAGFTAIGTGGLTANWTANGNPAGVTYTAILSTAPSPSTNGVAGNQTINTTNLSASFSSLAPNTLYYVAVNATSSGGSSAYTSLGSVPTLANPPTPGSPTAIGTNQITANWGANSNPPGTSYLVEASPNSGFSSITSVVTTTNSSATLTGLVAQTTYFMQVQASNQVGAPTAFIQLPSATTLTTPPNVPGAAGFTAIGTGGLTANWTANGNPAGVTYTAILSTAPSPSTNGVAGNQTINTTNLSAPFSSLAPNTLYYVAVNATSSGGSSAYTSLGSVPTLANPPTPGSPTAIGTNQITANWGANSNPPGTSYLVEASPNSGFSSITSAVTTTNSSATLTGLLAQTTYFMQVQASNQSGTSTVFVLLPQATTLTIPPNVPDAAGFTAVSTGGLTANWTANGNPAGVTYTAILSTAPSPSTNGLGGNQTIITTNLSAPFSSLAPNTLYYVTVNATSSGGSSAYTSLGSVATLANQPTAGNPTAIGTNQITANWGTNGNPVGTQYLVEASPNSGFSSITSAVTTTNSSATLTGLLAQTTYFMQVQASNQGGTSTAFVLLPQATTLTIPPGLPGPAGFTAIGTSGLTANWTANGNPNGTLYSAVLSTAPSPSTNGLAGNQTINTTNLSAPFSSLAPNTLYYVAVNATSSGGSSIYISLGSVPTLANQPAPGNPTAIGTNQITANWGANGNPPGTSYLVEASPNSGFSSITSAVTTTNSSATLSGLLAQTTYFMQVQASNQSAIATAFVLLPQATTLTIPPNVPVASGFTAIGTIGLTANWTANGNPAGTSYTAILSTTPSPNTNGLGSNQTIITTNLSAPFTGLAPNTLYYAAVNATSSGGSSAYTSLGSAPTLANPPTPGSPTAIGTNQITANWSANSNPPGTSYLVEASPNSGFSSITSAVTTTNSSATLTGLLAQTTYFMQVQASNQGGTSTAFVLLPQATTLTIPPNVPGAAGFTAIGTGGLTANWTANGNPAGITYAAILSTAPSPNTNGLGGNQTINTTNLSAPFSSLAPNTLYYVAVNATSSGGNSAYMSLGSVPTLANQPAPGNPTAIGTNEITANWGANGNPSGTSYLVEASPNSGFSSITSAVTTTNSSATLTGLLAQTTYFMQVQASNQSGTSTVFVLLPQAITLTIPPGLPGPAGFTAIGTGGLTANWTANGNSVGTLYSAVLSTAPSPSTNGVAGNQTINTTNLSAPFTSLAPNTLYYAAVNATSSGGSSAYTSLGSAPTLANSPTPGSPTAIGTNQITANWSANSNPPGTSYLVEASPNSGFSSITSAVTTTNSSATLTGLLPQTTYFMQVQASNQVGTPTAFTPLPQATTLTTPPNVPNAAGFTGAGIGQLTANWGANGNPAGTFYNAILSTAPSPSTNGGADNLTINTTNLSAPFTSLAPNTLYYAAVNATSSGGSSAYTSLGSAPTLANPPTPGSPTAIGTNQITANWGANGNPPGTSYLVEASPDSGFSSITSAVTTTNSSATLTGLLAETTYFMQVQASNQGGTSTAFVLLPQATTLTIPPNVPVASGFTAIDTNGLTANWTANGNPAGTSYAVILSTAPSPNTNGLTGNQTINTTNLSAPFTSLAPNTLYYAAVNATSTGGSSAYTSLGSVSTLANQPTPSALTGVSSNQITANWGANGNPSYTSYLAQASLDPAFGFISVELTTTSVSTTFASLAPDTTYYLRVQALNLNSVGTSFVLLGSTVTFGNPPSAPGPAGYSNITTNQLQANWTANGNIAGTSYTAILSTAASPSTNDLIGNQNTTGTSPLAIFAGLLPNTLYYVDVQASNLDGVSPFTSLGAAATLANTPVSGIPSGIQANQITANWGANNNPLATSYLVQASADSGFSSIAVTNTSTTTFSTLVGLSPNTTYYMRVQAINQNSIPTGFVTLPSTTTLANAPAVAGPLNFSNVTGTQIQANWTANGNQTGTSYIVVLSTEASPSTNGLSTNQTITTQATSIVFTPLIPNTLYFADVRASNSNGQSAITSLNSVVTLANAPTSSNPTNVGTNQLTANWGANGNPTDTLYFAEIGLDPNFNSFINFSPTTSTFATFGGLSPNTTYYMRVEAINQAAQPTAFTILPPIESVVTVPGLPVLTASQITDTAITWSWAPVTNASNYRLIDENGVQDGPLLPSSTDQFQDTGLAVNTAYSRSLVAINASGVSTSTLVTVYTLAHVPGTLSAQSITSNSITLTWDPDGNPSNTTYVANLLQNGASRQITETGPPTQATFNNLTGATTYFFSVQAFNGNGVLALGAAGTFSAVTLPQTETSNQICPSASIGSTLSFNGPSGIVRVDIPPGAFSQCVVMTVKIPGTFPSGSSTGTPLQGTGVGIEIDNSNTQEPVLPITLTVPYTPANIPNILPNQLVLARYDTTHNAWVMLSSTVNPIQNFVTAQTTELSLYQIMVTVPPSSLSNILIYPNPMRPAVGWNIMNFTNIPTDATIQLYTLTGEKVRELTATPLGTAVWDGTNQSGQAVASGVYFAVVKSGGDKTVLKVAVER